MFNFKVYPKGLNGSVVVLQYANGLQEVKELEMSAEMARLEIENERKVMAQAEKASQMAKAEVLNGYFNFKNQVA